MRRSAFPSAREKEAPGEKEIATSIAIMKREEARNLENMP
jgi:hypothetical protein